MTDVSEALEAIARDDVETLRRLLAARPGLASARSPDGVSLLLVARYRWSLLAVEAILEARPELDVFDAAALGRTEEVARFLDEDPGRRDELAGDGFTALHLASYFGHLDVVRLLLERGAEVDVIAMNAQRVTPLHSAAAGGHAEIASLLLEHGADVNARQHGGWTALHAAAERGDEDLAEAFLTAGADTTARNDLGESPADTAVRAGHDRLAGRLEMAANPSRGS